MSSNIITQHYLKTWKRRRRSPIEAVRVFKREIEQQRVAWRHRLHAIQRRRVFIVVGVVVIFDDDVVVDVGANALRDCARRHGAAVNRRNEKVASWRTKTKINWKQKKNKNAQIFLKKQESKKIS